MPLIQLVSEELPAHRAFPLSFQTQEELSRTPLFQLEIASAEPDLDYSELLGKQLTVLIEQKQDLPRPFHLYIVGGEDAGQQGTKSVYRLTLSCWLWFLQQNRNCKIFQNKNVPTIIEEVFARYGVARYRLDLSENYPGREYCVQFAESDFNFISRLMEDEGIIWFFAQEDEQHTLVITDNQTFQPLSLTYDQLLYSPDGEEQRAIREGIQRLQRARQVHSSDVVLRDYDYLNPRNNLQTHATNSSESLPDTPLEWYDYASGYSDRTRGETIARLRLQQFSAQGQMLSGESNATGLKVGHAFSLSLHPDQNRNRRFKLISCAYRYIQDGPDSSAQGRNVTCRFTAINDDVIWRPARITPKPQLPGIQSATVVGAPESEVHTDSYGRIRVHFHWDRYKTSEEDSSCWIRVVQAWAGKGWGVIAMPRVGQEVLVSYIDGDLDRPLVSGIVYNGDNPPPYRLPEQINYTGLVSRSLKQGQPQHASQITFDDKRGNERLMLHAERDMQTSSGRNDIRDVGNDAYERINRTKIEDYQDHIVNRDNYFSTTKTQVMETDTSFTSTKTSVTSTEDETATKGTSTTFTAKSSSVTGISHSTTGISTSRTGISTSMVGISTGMTGISTSMTGVSTSMTGVSTGMTGVSTSFTGIGTSFTGVSTGFTGVDTSFTGVATSTTGVSTSTTGVSTSMVGSSNSTTGLSISNTSAAYSQVGVDLKTAGMQSKN
ncbi:MAG TPA: type VI secretion system tip protein VgrG [Pantoea sp.]|nr:type VI secretion system tip protein VgrG [Pantoea sp.]